MALPVAGATHQLCKSMKKSIMLLTFILSLTLHANEDHLLMIPTPIIDNGAQKIHIVNRPMISGYGADFEGMCGSITAPYLAEFRSPSSEETHVDLNPASIAKIQISAVLPEKSHFYTITVDYTNATEDSLNDIDLLRSLLTCVYMYGDSLYGKLALKANFELVGLAEESALHGELSRFIKARKERMKKPDGVPGKE